MLTSMMGEFGDTIGCFFVRRCRRCAQIIQIQDKESLFFLNCANLRNLRLKFYSFVVENRHEQLFQVRGENPAFGFFGNICAVDFG